MIYTPLTRLAMRIAYDAHHGQVDKAGVPYIYHPCHLAEQMTDELSACAALLHDVVEDTPVTLAFLACSFPPPVIDALRLLTRTPGGDYLDYVRAIGQNPIARRVKLADLAHNLDETRLAGSRGARQPDREKYLAARAILLAAE